MEFILTLRIYRYILLCETTLQSIIAMQIMHERSIDVFRNEGPGMQDDGCV